MSYIITKHTAEVTVAWSLVRLALNKVWRNERRARRVDLSFPQWLALFETLRRIPSWRKITWIKNPV